MSAPPAGHARVSLVVVWELTTKARLGKLPGALAVAADVPRSVAAQGFVELPISLLHAQRAGGLRVDHRDPFDRMLIAQAQIEDLPIVSNEALFDAFSVARVW